jgi:trk system potassium uptake protein TrkH
VLIASCSGSTGGGIKMIRAQILFMETISLVKQLVHPRAVLVIRLGGHTVGTGVMLGVLGFIMLFGATTVVAVLLLVATGLDFISAITGTIACITNTGPGLGAVGPAGNYASLLPMQKWIFAATMLLGRLELFTLLVVFTPAFWRK